jgi:hypothetical protein
MTVVGDAGWGSEPPHAAATIIVINAILVR